MSEKFWVLFSIVFFVVFIAWLSFILTHGRSGDVKHVEPNKPTLFSEVKTFLWHDHQYIIFRMPEFQNFSVVHDPDCPKEKTAPVMDFRDWENNLKDKDETKDMSSNDKK